MIQFGAAHIGAGLGGGERQTLGGKYGDQRLHRRHAAKIDDGAGPIEHHSFYRKAHASSPKVRLNRSPITRSASAMPVEAPVPLVTITSRTPGSGVPMR